MNDKTVLDAYPLPNIRHFTSKIRGSKLFSRIDLKKAFHHVPLDEASQLKTASVTPWGTFKWKKLPMGLKNSAQSFQRLMDAVLAGVEGCFVYMDDILIFSKSEQQHLATIEEILRCLEEAGLTISIKKCSFGKESIDFLGYHVDAQGISPLPRKLKAIAEYPSPQKSKQLLGFLGALNYYRRALPKMEVDGVKKRPAEILQPLYEAATKKATGSFTQMWQEQGLEEHFQTAKELLMLACRLTHLDPNAPLALTTDASKVGI